jgi:Tfp pilus assembly protein PilX
MRVNFKGQTGSALIVILLLMLMLAVIGFQMVTTSNDDVTLSGNSKNATRAFYAAESGLALARSMLWAGYVTSASTNPDKKSGDVGDRASYVKFLESLGLADGTTIIHLTWVTDSGSTR